MKRQEILGKLSTPLIAPPYPYPPFYFKNREVLCITYRTDYDMLRHLVPEPLEVDKDKPYVKFIMLKVPDASGLGSYMECGQNIPVTYQEEEGDYVHALYVDNFPAIASGREVSAYPKKTGKPNMYIDSDVLVGTLDYGTLHVATATMGYKHKKYDLDMAKQEAMRPVFMLKMEMDYDFTYSKCDLVKGVPIIADVKEAWEGPARLQLFEHVAAPLADLPVKEVVSAYHFITDVQLGAPKPVYDYLNARD